MDQKVQQLTKEINDTQSVADLRLLLEERQLEQLQTELKRKRRCSGSDNRRRQNLLATPGRHR